jgi:hypothetical protein
MQYHQMMKQKHEQEMKAAEEQAKKKKEIEMRVQAAQAEQAAAAAAGVASPSTATPSPAVAATTPKAGISAEEEAERARLAEKAAEELLKMEEREKASKKAFSSNSKGMKKGFLESKGKKKK